MMLELISLPNHLAHVSYEWVIQSHIKEMFNVLKKITKNSKNNLKFISTIEYPWNSNLSEEFKKLDKSLD